MQRSENDDQAEAISANMRETVDAHGWAAVAVDDQPPFCYTAGLWRLADHPELIVTGLPAETAKLLLDRAVALVRAGTRLDHGASVAGLIGEYPAAVRRVDASNLPQLGFAADLYRGVVFTALQLVWPDRTGRFPWDRGVAPSYVAAQPLLFAERSPLQRLFRR